MKTRHSVRGDATDKVLQGLTGGLGFFGGYLWVVLRWVEGRGGAEALLEAAVPAGVILGCLYGALLLILFWRWIPSSHGPGLRVVVSPVSFTASFLLGVAGISGALALLAG